MGSLNMKPLGACESPQHNPNITRQHLRSFTRIVLAFIAWFTIQLGFFVSVEKSGASAPETILHIDCQCVFDWLNGSVFDQGHWWAIYV